MEKTNKADQKLIGLAKILLKISRNDLISSRLLVNNRLYPQSLFFLQQSVEKATKSIGLILGIIEEKDLCKTIGHKSMKIFEFSFKSIDAMVADFKIDIDKNPELQQKFKKEFEQYDSQKRKYVKFFLEFNKTQLREPTPKQRRNINKRIIKLLNEIEEIDLELKRFRNSKEYRRFIKSELLKDHEKEFRKLIQIYLPKKIEIEQRKKIRVLIKMAARKYSKAIYPPFLLELSYVMEFLFFMSMATADMSNSTRYPINGKDPTITYKRRPKSKRFNKILIPMLYKTQNKIAWIITYLMRKEFPPLEKNKIETPKAIEESSTRITHSNEMVNLPTDHGATQDKINPDMGIPPASI